MQRSRKLIKYVVIGGPVLAFSLHAQAQVAPVDVDVAGMAQLRGLSIGAPDSDDPSSADATPFVDLGATASSTTAVVATESDDVAPLPTYVITPRLVITPQITAPASTTAPDTIPPTSAAPTPSTTAAPAATGSTSTITTVPAPTIPPTTTTTALPTTTVPLAADHQLIGQRALASISWDWQTALPGWSVLFLPETSGYLGGTWPERKDIEVYVRSEQTFEHVVHILGHELGHGLDVNTLNDGDRARWRAARGFAPDATWWGLSGESDFATPSGDFAEAFSAWLTGPGYFRSELAGPPDADDISLLAEFAARR